MWINTALKMETETTFTTKKGFLIVINEEKWELRAHVEGTVRKAFYQLSRCGWQYFISSPVKLSLQI